MARIRLTFYTGSDDFSSFFTVDDAREWVRSRVSGPSVVTTPSGMTKGKSVDDLDPSELSKWLAVLALSEAKASKTLNVREHRGKWVSILPERVEAVGAEVTENDRHTDTEEREEDDPSMLLSELFEPSPWVH